MGWTMTAAALLLFAFAAEASVLGIDFGSDFIKVAEVRPNVGIEIVLNEQSKRKSNNYIGFRGEDRFLGEDAYNLAPRFPKQMYTFLNRLVGKKHDDEYVRYLSEEWSLPYNYVKNENRSTIDIKHDDPDVTYTGEELLSQVFSYIKRMSDKSNAVVAIPSFFDLSQRQAIVNAANLTGLNILGLIHHTTAAALQYGIQRRPDTNTTTNLLIYDMGASRLEIGVYQFTPPSGDPSKFFGDMKMLAIASDETLGGRTFDARIARFLAKKFEETTKEKLIGETSKSALKAHTVLLRAANKAKEMLSANKEAPVAIEELYNGKRFFYTLTRQELEEECKDLFERSVPTLKRALEKAGVDELHAFELIGGGVRIPQLQTALSEAMGGRRLDRTLNGDECIALGSAFYAVQLIGGIRFKGYLFNETLPVDLAFKLSQIQGSDRPTAVRPLFTEPKLGTKKSITVARKQDFEIEIFTVNPQDGKSTPYEKFYIKGIEPTLEKVDFHNETKHHPNNTYSVQVQIRLGHDSILELESAQVKYDEVRTVPKRIKVKAVKNETENATAEATAGADNNETANGNTTAEEEVKYKLVNRTEVKKHREQLTAEKEYQMPSPMSPEDYLKSKGVLDDLQKIEDKKKATAAAKNDLETHLYWIKYEGFFDGEEVVEEMKEFVTEEDQAAVRKAIEEVDDWMDMYGSDDLKETDYVEKKKVLEEAAKPAMDRKKAKEEAKRKEEEEARKAEIARQKEEAKKAAEEARKAAEEAKKAAEEAKKEEGNDKEAEDDKEKKEKVEEDEKPDES